MSRLNRLMLTFSILFTVFLIGPAFLGGPFGPYPLMKWGDVFDLITPLVLLPLYWLIFATCCEKKPNQRENLLFIALAALWAMGHGLHLAANSIGHLLVEGSDVYTLTYFYDEHLSHYLWHLGIVGLAILLMVKQWRHPFSEEQGALRSEILAGIIHGFTLFLIFIEAGTAPLGILFVLIITLVTLIWGRDKLKDQPLITFIFTSCTVALLFLAGWGGYWREWPLPQFSEKGLI